MQLDRISFKAAASLAVAGIAGLLPERTHGGPVPVFVLVAERSFMPEVRVPSYDPTNYPTENRYGDAVIDAVLGGELAHDKRGETGTVRGVRGVLPAAYLAMFLDLYKEREDDCAVVRRLLGAWGDAIRAFGLTEASDARIVIATSPEYQAGVTEAALDLVVPMIGHYLTQADNHRLPSLPN